MTVTLITGANKGIGFATAKQLAEQGHDVYIGARDAERGAKAAAAIGARLVHLDVTDDASVRGALAEIDAAEGRPRRAPASSYAWRLRARAGRPGPSRTRPGSCRGERGPVGPYRCAHGLREDCHTGRRAPHLRDLLDGVRGDVPRSVAGITAPGVGELFVIYLDPAERGRGLGTLLLDRVAGQVVSGGAREMWVSVTPGNERGLPFYRARGFEVVDKVKAYGSRPDDDIWSLRLRKPLGAAAGERG
jgi:GNAT superfamily N-acetyltransferase